MPAERVIDAEALFAAARNQDHAAFADWMGCVERPIQASLRRFARVVDLEVVMQETFARMWVLACDRSRVIDGPNAPLRFAIGIARNVAREEVRRARLGRVVSLEDLADPPEPGVFDDPPADPGFMRIIQACLDRLPRRPREAILARIAQGHFAHDRSLAAGLQMSVNTFLQNIVRARSLLARCLKERGAPVEEFVS